MPLKRGKSKKVISENIREMMHSSRVAGKSPAKKRQMAAAAAYQKARESGASLPKKRGTHGKKKKKAKR